MLLQGECLETFASEMQYSEPRIAEVRQRLKSIELVRRKHGAATADRLVEMADEAAARLGNAGAGIGGRGKGEWGNGAVWPLGIQETVVP